MQPSNLWVWSVVQAVGFVALVLAAWLIAPWLGLAVLGLGLLIYGTLREMGADGTRTSAAKRRGDHD